MTTATLSGSDKLSRSPADPPLSALDRSGEVEIAGRRYITADRLARILGVTVRTLNRWNATRSGPPRIKKGKLVLFDISKLPDYLASHETGPVRGTRKWGAQS
jgi:hypothetical protein